MENQNNLELNAQAQAALKESAKWSMFLAILGFVGIGFMIIAAIFMGSVMAIMPDDPYSTSGAFGSFGAMKGFISIIYIVVAAIYFMPVFYLYKYASGMKTALATSNSDLVSNSFVQLKSHHKFLGISMIVLISLYIIIIIGLVVTFASAAASGM